MFAALARPDRRQGLSAADIATLAAVITRPSCSATLLCVALQAFTNQTADSVANCELLAACSECLRGIAAGCLLDADTATAACQLLLRVARVGGDAARRAILPLAFYVAIDAHPDVPAVVTSALETATLCCEVRCTVPDELAAACCQAQTSLVVALFPLALHAQAAVVAIDSELTGGSLYALLTQLATPAHRAVLSSAQLTHVLDAVKPRMASQEMRRVLLLALGALARDCAENCALFAQNAVAMALLTDQARSVHGKLMCAAWEALRALVAASDAATRAILVRGFLIAQLQRCVDAHAGTSRTEVVSGEAAHELAYLCVASLPQVCGMSLALCADVTGLVCLCALVCVGVSCGLQSMDVRENAAAWLSWFTLPEHRESATVKDITEAEFALSSASGGADLHLTALLALANLTTGVLSSCAFIALREKQKGLRWLLTLQKTHERDASCSEAILRVLHNCAEAAVRDPYIRSAVIMSGAVAHVQATFSEWSQATQRRLQPMVDRIVSVCREVRCRPLLVIALHWLSVLSQCHVVTCAEVRG